MKWFCSIIIFGFVSGFSANGQQDTYIENNQEDIHEYYDSILLEADIAYSLQQWQNALTLYKIASEEKPYEYYPKERISEVEHRLSQRKNFAYIKNYDYEKSRTLVLILIYFIIYSIASMIILLLVILINRNRVQRRETLRSKLKEKYQNALMNYLFDDELNNNVPKRLMKISGTSFKRKVLIDEMLDLSINLSGEIAEKMRQLYMDLELHKESLTKAYSKYWHVKVKGFRELAFMNIKDANDEIIRSLQSSNDILRGEAQLALIRLEEEYPFYFLDHLEKTFTLWEQMVVYEMIIHHHLKVPEFKDWLYCKNLSVVMFSLNMIQIFKQTSAFDDLIKKLEDSREKIRNKAIMVLGGLIFKESIPSLKERFYSETYDNKLAILYALRRMKEPGNFAFLEEVLENEEDVFMQIEAAKAIRDVEEKGPAELDRLLNKEQYRSYQIILKHVLDKRL